MGGPQFRLGGQGGFTGEVFELKPEGWREQSTEMNPCLYHQLIFNKEPRIHNGKRIVFSTDHAGKTGYSHVKERNCTLILHETQRSTQNGSNVRPETVKLFEENTRRKLHNIGVGSGFMDMTSNAQATKAKIDVWGYIKLLSFGKATKETVDRMKEMGEWEKNFKIMYLKRC